MLTVHSMNAIAISIEEASQQNDYDLIVNNLILERFGEVQEDRGNYKLLQKFSDQSYTFSYGVENTGKKPLEITLDCNTSKSMSFSEPSGRVVKIVEPGTLMFLMHAEASPGAEEFAKGAEISHKELY